MKRCGSIRSGVGARVFVFISVSSLLTLSPSLPFQNSLRMRTLSHRFVGLTTARFLPSHTSVHGAGGPSSFLPTFPFPCSIPASSRSSAHHTLLFASAHSRYHHTFSSTHSFPSTRKTKTSMCGSEGVEGGCGRVEKKEAGDEEKNGRRMQGWWNRMVSGGMGGGEGAAAGRGFNMERG
jgi:hypothetical protein